MSNRTPLRQVVRDPLLTFVVFNIVANAWVLATGRTAILFDYSRPVALFMLVVFSTIFLLTRLERTEENRRKSQVYNLIIAASFVAALVLVAAD